MVKRIKKRVVRKEDTPEAEGLDGASGDELPEMPDEAGIRAELDALAQDDFTRQIAGGFGWVLDNRGLILAGIGLAAAAAIAIFVFQNSRQASIEEAAAAFSDAADTYQEAVERPAPGSDAKPLTDDEKKARVEKAQQAFARVQGAYAESPVSALAALGEANAQLDLGNAAAAIPLFDKALARPELEPLAKAVALQGKAAALESTGDVAGALEAWRAVEGIDKKALGLLAGMQMGRLLESSGKADEARKLYERLQTDYEADLAQLSNRALKADLERRLAQLGKAS